MDKYYYFVSQLPALQFGKETPISVEKFLNEASQWLTANDFKLLLKANEIKMPVEKVENRVLQQYFEFDAQVRSDIAHWRYAQRREEDFKPSTLSASFMKEGNPLEIEIRIMERRIDKTWIGRVFGFYAEGFRNLSSWGRAVWIVLLIKLFIIFAIIRLIFMPDYLNKNYENDRERGRHVLENLTEN